MSRQNAPILPAWFWLGIPLFAYFGQYVARAAMSAPVYERLLTSETGLTERATPLVLAVAFVLGLIATIHFWRRSENGLAFWFGLFTLGCLYFGGEEASWGQHWFGWSTPADWQALNNQNETNLHNSNALAGSLLDQLPRNLLGAAILVGGAFMPLWRRLRGRTLTPGSRSAWMLPGIECVPAGLIAPLASFPEKLLKKSLGDVPWPLDIEAGEVKELMLAIFLFVYISAVWVSLRRRNAG